MDTHRFDDFTRQLVTSGSRRRFLAGIAASILGSIGLRDAEARSCSGLKTSCREHANCCTGLCGTADSRGRRWCECPAKTVPCEDQCLDPATSFQSDPKNCGACGSRCPRTACQVATCSAGVCGLAPDPNAVNQRCDDGNACTTNDTCQADGSCKGTATVCAASDQCHDAGTCDPHTGVCSNPPKQNGTPCSDNNACTNTDTCQDGACRPGTDVVCNPPGPCQEAGICNHATGKCEYANKANGSSCDDGNKCTSNVCDDGECVVESTKSCDDNNPCTVDTCNPQTGACVNTAIACNDPGQCEGAGTCNPQTGKCEYVVLDDGTPCGAGDLCTGLATCQDGFCTSGEPVVCGQSSEQCYGEGVCNPETGSCDYPYLGDGSPCFDFDPCTVGDTCLDGFCSSGRQKSCPARNQCHAEGFCDSNASGNCIPNPLPNGSSCDGGSCCNGECCPAGKYCCGSGDNMGCCDIPCCGNVCCTFDRGVCCGSQFQTCNVGVPC